MLKKSSSSPEIVQQLTTMSLSKPIPFFPDFVAKDLEKLSHKVTVSTTANGSTTTETKKRYIPVIAAGATHHAVLYSIHEFGQTRRALSWTTGAKLFEVIARRKSHDHTVGDQFLIKTFKPSALQERYYGPYTITQVHSNGTVSYLVNEAVIGRINVRRIKPYFS